MIDLIQELKILREKIHLYSLNYKMKIRIEEKRQLTPLKIKESK